MGKNRNIYVIYKAEDTAVMQSLLQRLKSLEKDTNVTIWHDAPVLPEQPWKPKNESRLSSTDIFLLLVSDAFMHSQFIQQLAFKTVIDQYKEGRSTVIPIIIDKCPWDIDFRSDDYNFNLNELGVLPNKAKPIKEWDSTEQVYDEVATSIQAVIKSLSDGSIQEEPKDEKVMDAGVEEQIALSFNDEKESEEEKRREKEAAAERIAAAKKIRAEAEAKSRAEAEKRLQEEREAKRSAEAQRLNAEVERKKLDEEKRLEEAVESRIKIEEKERLREQMEAKHKAEEENRRELAAKALVNEEGTPSNDSSSRKKKLWIGATVALLAILGIWTFGSGPKKETQALPGTKVVEVEDSTPVEKIEIDPVVEEESVPKLEVGDNYQGGLVFAIGSEGRSGKIVHMDDAGPMPWLDAMIIHDQLGKGWRLPTLDELKTLYDTLGQGASNSAEFADKLYWSATSFDDYQARLLQFRTGNTSYHYNKQAEHRKFLVRAVRDF